jgi:hypothetical protein
MRSKSGSSVKPSRPPYRHKNDEPPHRRLRIFCNCEGGTFRSWRAGLSPCNVRKTAANGVVRSPLPFGTAVWGFSLCVTTALLAGNLNTANGCASDKVSICFGAGGVVPVFGGGSFALGDGLVRAAGAMSWATNGCGMGNCVTSGKAAIRSGKALARLACAKGSVGPALLISCSACAGAVRVAAKVR